MSMHPVIVPLAAGEHHICHCGESNTEPLCDGQQGSRCRQAQKFVLVKGGNIPICLCGRSKTSPICDGNHGYAK